MPTAGKKAIQSSGSREQELLSLKKSAERGMALLIEVLLEGEGQEETELRHLSAEDLWSVGMAYDFLAVRMRVLRDALRTAARLIEEPAPCSGDVRFE